MSGYYKASEVLYRGHFQFLRHAPGQLDIANNLLREAEIAEKAERAAMPPPQPTVWADAHEAIAKMSNAAPASNNAPTT